MCVWSVSAALSLSSGVLASRVLAGREPLQLGCVSLGVVGGCAVGSACGQRSATIFESSISIELRACRAPPPVLEAMESPVGRALRTVLDHTMLLDDRKILQMQLRAALLKMTGEELQAFVDGMEAVEAAGGQTSTARSLDAGTRSSEAGVRNVADARTDGSAQTDNAPLRKRKIGER